MIMIGWIEEKEGHMLHFIKCIQERNKNNSLLVVAIKRNSWRNIIEKYFSK